MLVVLFENLPLIVACAVGVILAYRKQSGMCAAMTCLGWPFVGVLALIVGPPPLMRHIGGSENVETMYVLILAAVVFIVGFCGIVRGRIGLYCVSLSMFALVALMCFCCSVLLLIIVLTVGGWYVSSIATVVGIVTGEHAFLVPILGVASAFVGYLCVKYMKRHWVPVLDELAAEEVS